MGFNSGFKGLNTHKGHRPDIKLLPRSREPRSSQGHRNVSVQMCRHLQGVQKPVFKSKCLW